MDAIPAALGAISAVDLDDVESDSTFDMRGLRSAGSRRSE